MKYYFALLALLISTACSAALLPPLTTVTIGGESMIPPQFSIMLQSVVTGGTNIYGTFKNANGSGGNGYQVTGGKTLYIMALDCIINATSADGVTIGYGDTDVNWSSTSLPTNPVYYAGVSTFYFNTDASSLSYAHFSKAFGSGFKVPSGKYPLLIEVLTGSGAKCTVYGYEQ